MPTRGSMPTQRGVGIDNTFQSHEKFLRSQDTKCYTYVKEDTRQRLYQEFENVHQKRLIKLRQRNETSEDFTPK